MGNPRCRWVRDRLPLLAGDDLQGLDRRRVERHLIGCPHCREHQASLVQALETLRTVASTASASPDAPSLWPALERQIRESRRPVPATRLTSPFVLAWPRLSFRPALGFGLGLLAAIGFSLASRHQDQTSVTQARVAVNERPLPAVVAAPKPRPTETPVPRPQQELPKTTEGSIVETSPSRRDYILEHGIPMPSGAPDLRDTKATY